MTAALRCYGTDNRHLQSDTHRLQVSIFISPCLRERQRCQQPSAELLQSHPNYHKEGGVAGEAKELGRWEGDSGP